MKHFKSLAILGLILMSFYIKDETSDLYERSLYGHLHKLNIDSVYLLKSSDIENLPNKIKSIRIINISDSSQAFFLREKGQYVVKLMPIRVNKGNIEVCIINYTLEEEKGKILLSNEGSKVYTYSYKGNGIYKLIKEE